MERILFHATGVSTCLLPEEQGTGLRGKFVSVSEVFAEQHD